MYEAGTTGKDPELTRELPLLQNIDAEDGRRKKEWQMNEG